jgi:hypothetical protein
MGRVPSSSSAWMWLPSVQQLTLYAGRVRSAHSAATAALHLTLYQGCLIPYSPASHNSTLH